MRILHVADFESEEHETIKTQLRCCAVGREPYDEAEYIQMLGYATTMHGGKREDCGDCQNAAGRKCEALPVAGVLSVQSAECWNTRGWREMKLKVGMIRK